MKEFQETRLQEEVRKAMAAGRTEEAQAKLAELQALQASPTASQPLPTDVRLQWPKVRVLGSAHEGAKAIAQLASGEPFTVLSAQGEFYRVRLSDGAIGFVFARHLVGSNLPVATSEHRSGGGANVHSVIGEPTEARAAGLAQQAADYGVDHSRGDVLISGLTVVGGYGWSPSPGTSVAVGVCRDRLTVASVPFRPPLREIPYERITAFDFQGGARTRGGGFIGGGFGFEGAAKGILAATVLNTLTMRTEVNSVVRISAIDGEIYLHHGGILPEMLRTAFGPAVNAVSARSSRPNTDARPMDPVDRLDKLAKLREAGTLTQEEFDAAKAKIIRELT
jgi:hypothetical protein